MDCDAYFDYRKNSSTSTKVWLIPDLQYTRNLKSTDGIEHSGILFSTHIDVTRMPLVSSLNFPSECSPFTQ